jgi:glycosyltransferase involved in cell wall biosynthesis
VVVPSYRRPASLAVCLEALARQEESPDEVIVVTRSDDKETRALVSNSAGARFDLREAVVEVPGQIAALSSGSALATGDVVAFTDDDAAPRPDWVRRLKCAFDERDVVGVGGRDAILKVEPRDARTTVGRVRWSGKVIGNHHLGSGRAREVDVLKGANMAFRRCDLREHGFDERLRGAGAQVHNDLMLSLALRKAGGRLVYDPSVVVDHYPAIRPAGDLRSDPIARHQTDAVHNETLALLEYLPPGRRTVFMVWAFAIGRGASPGVAHTVWTSFKTRDPRAWRRLAPSLKGRWAGWRTFRRARMPQPRSRAS